MHVHGHGNEMGNFLCRRGFQVERVVGAMASHGGGQAGSVWVCA